LKRFIVHFSGAILNTVFYQISLAIVRALRVFTCFEVTDLGKS